MILEVRGPDGKVVWKAPAADVRQALSPEAAFLVTDILAGNTDRRQNPIWAEKLALANGPDRAYRPAAAKTGTANEARDLATYGFLAPPQAGTVPGLAVGIWMGNSDHSNPRTAKPATSLSAAAPALAGVRPRLHAGTGRSATSTSRSGVVDARVDAWSGGRPGPWTQDTTRELFIDGHAARRSWGQIDRPGLLYSRACGGWRVDPLKAELGPAAWDATSRPGCAGRAAGRRRRAATTRGPRTSGASRSWGGAILGPLPEAQARGAQSREGPKPKPPKDEPPKPPGGGGGGGGGGDGDWRRCAGTAP